MIRDKNMKGEFREMAKRKWRLSCWLCGRAAGARDTDGVAGSPASDFKPAACVDNTPHKIRIVTVAPGVELQVLDWGGKGAAMVLLTGSGDNAHVYDQFAFQFTDYFHVIGITRRGYLPSSQPRDGYDVPTRAQDDIAVLDALGIGKAVFVGHSAAGMELSRLGQALWSARREAGLSRRGRPVATLPAPSRREPPLPDLYRCGPEVAMDVSGRHGAVPGDPPADRVGLPGG